MTKPSPAEFVRQVRREVNKVTWPTRRETMISTALVLVLAAVAAIFFLITDNIISYVIQLILGLGI